jgi:hypothetical protein
MMWRESCPRVPKISFPCDHHPLGAMAWQPTSHSDSTTDSTQSTSYALVTILRIVAHRAYFSMFSGASQFTIFAGAITNVGGNYTAAAIAPSGALSNQHQLEREHSLIICQIFA